MSIKAMCMAVELMTLPEGWKVMPGKDGWYFWPRYKDGEPTGLRDILIECKDPSLIIALTVPEDATAESLSVAAAKEIERVMKMHTEGRYAPWPEPGEPHSPDMIYWPQRYVLRNGQRIEF